MPYQVGGRQLWRRYARGNYGLRGMGQACLQTDTDPTSPTYGECIDYGGDLPTTGPIGSSNVPAPAGSLVNAQGNTVVPGATIPGTTEAVSTGPGAIGSSQGCAAGYVVGDASGDCVPAPTLAATLSNAASASALGLTPTQAAAITAALKAATVAVGGPTTGVSYVAPAASTNPFSSISPTVWVVGGGALLLVLILSTKKR